MEEGPAAPRRRLTHIPALDGLRAASLIAIFLYHGGFSWARGGFLAVPTFFTLSGFLISSLLLAEVRDTGRVDLRAFWIARARRLVPAALAALALLVAFARFGASSTHLVGLREDLWASVAVVINWRLALTGQTYDNASDATPVQHLWTLAVEEQFYLMLPLVVVAVVALGRRTGRSVGGILGIGAAVAAVASTLALALTVDEDDVSFAYYATHTRAAEILAGVVLACGMPWIAARRLRDRWVAGFSVACALAVIAAWATVEQSEVAVYRGGVALYTLGTLGLILGCIHRGAVRTVLSWGPLGWLGRVSYGAYLYHWPIFSWVREENTDLDLVPLFVVRIAITMTLAALSYSFLEMPIRRGRVITRVPRPAMAAVLLVAVAVTFAVPHRSVDTGPSGVEVIAGERVAAATGGDGPIATTEPTRAPVERLMLVGDSIPEQLAPYAAEALPEVEIRYVGEGGIGLLNDQALIVDEVEDAVASFDPDIVVVHLAGNYLRLSVNEDPYLLPDGTPVEDGTEEMFTQTEVESRALVAAAGARGATVLWALSPDVGPGTTFGFMQDRIPRLNGIYRNLGVGTLDWSALSRGPDGDYDEELPGPDGELERARDGDGLHFTAFGNRLLAATIVEQAEAWRGRLPADQRPRA